MTCACDPVGLRGTGLLQHSLSGHSAIDHDPFDLGLFGAWAPAPDFGSAFASGVDDAAALQAQARSVVLEMKSAKAGRTGAAGATGEVGGTGEAGGMAAASGADADMRAILNEATQEIREQFEAFRRLRAAAERQLLDGDEAAQKLARADIKAATDAMSLIVRTLEKIDALQRQFARDRQTEAERQVDDQGDEEAWLAIDRLIAARAGELFRARCREAGVDPGAGAFGGGDGRQPDDDGGGGPGGAGGVGTGLDRGSGGGSVMDATAAVGNGRDDGVAAGLGLGLGPGPGLGLGLTCGVGPGPGPGPGPGLRPRLGHRPGLGQKPVFADDAGAGGAGDAAESRGAGSDPG